MNATPNAVCNGVTRSVSNAVRRYVQNQNQNQSSSTASCGVSNDACIRRQGCFGTTARTMHGRYRAEFGGGLHG